MTPRAVRTLIAGAILATAGGIEAGIVAAPFTAAYWLGAAILALGTGLIVGVGQATDARDRPLSRAELEDLWRRP